MKLDTTTASPKTGRVQVGSYAGVGWLLLSILLFTLVFLPVVLL